MKIAFIGQKGIPATYGGFERYVEELSTRLARRGHAVWVYVRPYYTKTTDKIYKGVYLVKVPTIRSKHLDTIVHVFLSTLHLLTLDVDIIYVHGVGPSSLVPLMRILKPRAKVVSVFQSRDSLHAKWGKFARFMLNIATWMTCKFPHETVTSSKELYRFAKESYGVETIQINNGAPEPSTLRSNEMEKKLGISQGSFFLMVTRFVRHKNIHRVIEAFKKLETDKKLVIVGGAVYTDKYFQELLELAKGDPRIIFTGFLSGSNLWELFQKTYAFIQSSGTEGMPLSVLEAMAYGCGVIASDIPEHRELLGDAALYFDLENSADLKAMLGLALKSPQSVFEKGALAKHRAKTYFGWDKITERVEELFGSLLVPKEARTKAAQKKYAHNK
jgi:glycosyltransferase involved in cell wall biosynthesis